MPADELTERHRGALAAFSAAVDRLVPVLEEIALAAVRDVLPTAHRLEVLGEMNEDWAWTLRIQRVFDADDRVLFDVALRSAPMPTWRTTCTRSASTTSIYSWTSRERTTSART